MCANVKMSLGQGAEGFPSLPQQRLLGVIVALQCDSIKCVHWSLAVVLRAVTGIVFPALSFSKGHGSHSVVSAAPEKQKLCCPCSRALLSAVVINSQSRAVSRDRTVWCVKAIVVLQ